MKKARVWSMEEETVVSVHLCHKFTSILGEAEDDGSTPPQVLSVFRSIQRRIDDAVSSIPHDLLYDVIDAVSECRIFFAGQKGASSAKPLFGLTRFFFTKKMMRRLVDIETRLQQLSNHRSQPLSPRKSMIKEITRSHPTSTIFGLKSEAQEMEDWLMSYTGASTSAGRNEAAAGKEAFMGIGIVGIRCGCGKTSLAHKVFSSPTVESMFSPRIWVCLSNMLVEADDGVDPISRMVIDILKELGQDVSELRDADYSIVKLLEKLHHKLMGKRYLIVLDDAWEMEGWWGDLGYTLPRGYPMDEFLSHGLPKGSPGGAVIVTSRWESVAKRMIGNDKYLIRLENKLSDEVCWEIFCEHLEAEARRLKQDVISICDAHALPLKILKPDFISIFNGLPLAAKILKQDVISICDAKILKQDVILICDGLPLAAKILAHALLSKDMKLAVDRIANKFGPEFSNVFDEIVCLG